MLTRSLRGAVVTEYNLAILYSSRGCNPVATALRNDLIRLENQTSLLKPFRLGFPHCLY
ncbi:MAG: hypothetical protein QOF72_1231 [Blastocatellia bacterium]|jgi:hypothetical protein|nr:hypothetical protein [Blastocatellia bacterium]